MPRASSRKATPEAEVAELSYAEAHTALELALARLQASDLPVESMAAVYQQARRYAERCQQVLDQVEQRVHLWDPAAPEQPSQPFTPER
jgi:exodeoxyribonuclease VII small subunit